MAIDRLGRQAPSSERAIAWRLGRGPLAGPLNLVDRSQILVGMVLIGRQEPLEHYLKQGHHGLGALLDLPHQLQVLEGKAYGKAGGIVVGAASRPAS